MALISAQHASTVFSYCENLHSSIISVLPNLSAVCSLSLNIALCVFMRCRPCDQRWCKQCGTLQHVASLCRQSAEQPKQGEVGDAFPKKSHHHLTPASIPCPASQHQRPARRLLRLQLAECWPPHHPSPGIAWHRYERKLPATSLPGHHPHSTDAARHWVPRRIQRPQQPGAPNPP